MSAKAILKEICETALLMPRRTRVSRTVDGIRVSLQMFSLTEGLWTLQLPDGERFTTTSVHEAEIKLSDALSKVGAARGALL